MVRYALFIIRCGLILLFFSPDAQKVITAFAVLLLFCFWLSKVKVKLNEIHSDC